MGRHVPRLPGRGPLRGDRYSDPVAAAGHRRDFDLADGSVLSGRRPVPIDHSVCDFPAGLGLAHSQWSHHVVARHPRPGAMAGLGLWVIGLFVGIELVFYGVAWIALALDLRSLA